jgi:O-glycosyl hydrolase
MGMPGIRWSDLQGLNLRLKKDITRFFPDLPKQVIRGFGFEIQADSISSGNKGLPVTTTSVPHDLTPAERQRFYHEMLHGFRYCRLAGGLYWRGLDPEQKYLQGRWPEQLSELREMIQAAGIEGVSLEYWSPAPFWKANRKYIGEGENVLRCFGKNFINDAVYHGDVEQFLNDFAGACRRDLEMLCTNGIPVSMWGLLNEPFAFTPYSSCVYRYQDYATTFSAVAPVVRAFNPHIEIIADTGPNWKFPFIRPVLTETNKAGLVDALVIHHVGSNANAVLDIPPNHDAKPRFQNEYEYLDGPASPARCLNTVQHIMNWFQIGEAPTWFWIHALKPIDNAEASGYSLGFWRSATDTNLADHPKFSGLQPGHWTWNQYNWYAVGSFLRHMPWDCRAVEILEKVQDKDLRLLAFLRPNGKLTIVLSNRSFKSHTFHISTGLKSATFKGYRYTPETAGENTMGMEIGSLKGDLISPKLDDMTWEFWEQ